MKCWSCWASARCRPVGEPAACAVPSAGGRAGVVCRGQRPMQVGRRAGGVCRASERWLASSVKGRGSEHYYPSASRPTDSRAARKLESLSNLVSTRITSLHLTDRISQPAPDRSMSAAWIQNLNRLTGRLVRKRAYLYLLPGGRARCDWLRRSANRDIGDVTVGWLPQARVTCVLCIVYAWWWHVVETRSIRR
jgi:hypothetical protein